MGRQRTGAAGAGEIGAALAEGRRLFLAVGLFSAFVNLLMLTGPVFMLQVYDRVLTSGSEATLVTLVGIVAFLFLMMGLLDHFRARVLARAGARFQARMDPRVLGAILTRAGASPQARSAPATGLADLEAMQRFASGPGPFAFFDAPWTPIFLFALFAFHWMLGLLAVGSGVLLLVLALMNQTRTARLQRDAGDASARAFHLTEQVRAGGETVRGLGMRGAALERLARIRNRALDATIAASDRGGAFTVTARTLRLFLQSMMLGLGAWLAIQGSITPGVMIAASILLGRALAPIDQAVFQWPVLQRALEGRRALARLLAETPAPPELMPLPDPDPAALDAAGQPLLAADRVHAGAPGAERPAVRGASFALHPGRAVGIAGPSASGKSTLARVLAGVWPPRSGAVTLGGAALDQYGEAALSRHLGWLPQEVVLFEGSVAENIARLDPDPDPAAVVAAARHAGAHEMILALPGGYDFEVAAGGAALSGGQRQRIALARAFYGDPAAVVLDEPDAHLDAEGAAALDRAVAALKTRGGAAVIVAHRPGAFAQCETVLAMVDGALRPMEPASSRRPPGAVPVTRVAGPPEGAGTGVLRLVDPDSGERARDDPDRERRGTGARQVTVAAPPLEPRVARGGPASLRYSSRRPVGLGLLTLAVLLGGALGWGALASISGAVIASGLIEVESRAHAVEHVDGGTVQAVQVRDGDRVAAGDVLIRLADGELRTEEALLAAEEAELVARRNRLEAEYGEADALRWDPDLARRAAADAGVRAVLDGQQRLFDARRATLTGQAAQLGERIAQTRRQAASLEAQLAAVRRQAAILERELVPLRGLLADGLVELPRVLELERAAARLDGEAGDIGARIAAARSRIAEIELQILQLAANRVAEAEGEAREVQAREVQVRERLASVRVRLARMEVRAPVAGEVFEMQVFAPSEVVRPGEPILKIVPADAALLVRARIETIHVDQVWPGQEARLLFPGVPARTTPAFEGRVLRVAADASRDPRAGLAWYEIELEIGRAIGPEGERSLAVWAGRQRDRLAGWVAGREWAPDWLREQLAGDGPGDWRAGPPLPEEAADAVPTLALTPGMPVEVHLRTGERSPLSYLVKPLTDYFSRSLREE